MKSFLDLCTQRRSVRKYDPTRSVPRETLDRCLEAARLAPSACNSQPWSFWVIDDPVRVRALADKAFTGAYSMNRFAAEAPVLIVVIAGESRFAAKLGGFFRGMSYRLIDIGIAGEHLALQAAEEGLGACWLGWFNERAVRRALGLPRSTRIDIIFSLGYALDEPRAKNRRTLDEIRRYVHAAPQG